MNTFGQAHVFAAYEFYHSLQVTMKVHLEHQAVFKRGLPFLTVILLVASTEDYRSHLIDSKGKYMR